MISTSNLLELNVKTINNLVSDEQLFKYYFKNNLEIGKVYCSPLRKDNKPSFSIFSNYNILRYKDFANGDTGNIWNFICKKFSCNFNEALCIVDNDFNLGIRNNTYINKTIANNLELLINENKIPIRKYTDIKVRIRDWNSKEDKEYWFDKYSITCKLLKKFDIYPLTHFWINDRLAGEASKNKPIYGYYFGDDKWKIYRPLNDSYRWFNNTNYNIIQGYRQLPENGEYLVITKSLKDILVYNLLDISAIAPQSEGILLKENIIEELKSRFTNIIVNFDYDLTGVSSANKYKKKYGLKSMFFKEYKDISDTLEKIGLDKLKEIINNIEICKKI